MESSMRVPSRRILFGIHPFVSYRLDQRSIECFKIHVNPYGLKDNEHGAEESVEKGVYEAEEALHSMPETEGALEYVVVGVMNMRSSHQPGLSSPAGCVSPAGFASLPDDVASLMYAYLEPVDLTYAVRLTCKAWHIQLETFHHSGVKCLERFLGSLEVPHVGGIPLCSQLGFWKGTTQKEIFLRFSFLGRYRVQTVHSLWPKLSANFLRLNQRWSLVCSLWDGQRLSDVALHAYLGNDSEDACFCKIPCGRGVGANRDSLNICALTNVYLDSFGVELFWTCSYLLRDKLLPSLIQKYPVGRESVINTSLSPLCALDFKCQSLSDVELAWQYYTGRVSLQHVREKLELELFPPLHTAKHRRIR